MDQINFLNSVIVDLQRKNEELKVKLKKMALTEFNGNDENDGWVQFTFDILTCFFMSSRQKKRNILNICLVLVLYIFKFV